MLRPPLLLSLRIGAAALCLLAASGAHAGGATPSMPLVLAQADSDAPPDDGQSGGTAALLIRIERLEDRLRTLTGQVEQLQFQNKKLDDQMRKMQQDVDFRFQDLNRTPTAAPRPAPQKRTDAGDPAAPIATASVVDPVVAAPAAMPAVTVEVPKPAKRIGDAFDPNANPEAPGAPKALGTTMPSQPVPSTAAAPAVTAPALTSTPHAPLDLTPNGVASAQESTGQPAQEVAMTPDAGVRPTPPMAGGTRGDYDADFVFYKSGLYDAAIDGFQSFLQKYPKDKLVPDATYFLGESFARQGRHREAAEQFLKLSTDYSTSTRAPDALLRLGVALNALGAKEQACATYQEVDRKFPSASPIVRASVERELKRAKC